MLNFGGNVSYMVNLLFRDSLMDVIENSITATSTSKQHAKHTGSSRKNEKSKLRSRGVYFYKILIFTPVPGRKIATNYSPTSSRSLRNVLRLPSKVAPPTLTE